MRRLHQTRVISDERDALRSFKFALPGNTEQKAYDCSVESDKSILLRFKEITRLLLPASQNDRNGTFQSRIFPLDDYLRDW